MAEQRRRNSQRIRRTEYINGNAVRNPQREMERRHVTRELPLPGERRLSHAAQKNRDKALNMSLPFVLFLAAATAVVVLISFQYLAVKNSVTTTMKSIQSMESELLKLTEENDDLQSKIDTMVSMDYIYDVATNELGMVKATDENVILYDRTESEYVRQYENIPEE